MNEFKIIYVKDMVDIVNFTKIIHFDLDKIILESKNKTCVISGNNLVVSKLLIDEILVSGDINKIELR